VIFPSVCKSAFGEAKLQVHGSGERGRGLQARGVGRVRQGTRRSTVRFLRLFPLSLCRVAALSLQSSVCGPAALLLSYICRVSFHEGRGVER